MTYPDYEVGDRDEGDLKKLNDPNGLTRRSFEKLMSMILEKADRLETNEPRLYALVTKQLSQESSRKR